jgi:dihydroorotase
MEILFKNAKVFRDGSFQTLDALVCQGRLAFPADCSHLDAAIVEGRNICILPGLADVHVHLREPGFSYKETIAAGTRAAARGGFTTVCSMPNLNPVPDSLETLQAQLDIISRDACVQVVPYGAITQGEGGQALADMEAMSGYVCGFSDDGKGVQSQAMMALAMEKAKALGKIIAAHCEDNSLLHGGYIHEGDYAKAHGHRGICAQSEWGPIERDAALAGQIGCAYHVCHVSTAQSVEVIRRAKAAGVDITCETAPHYLVFNDSQLQEDGRFKMNPPIRSESDRQALLAGILDGTIDMIATDHAPHSREEKAQGLEKSLMGVVGLETAFPVLYTELVRPGVITLEKLVALMCLSPRARFGLPVGQDFTVFDLDESYVIDPEQFETMGRATPFAGRTVYGKCLMTVCQGKVAWQAIDN